MIPFGSDVVSIKRTHLFYIGRFVHKLRLKVNVAHGHPFFKRQTTRAPAVHRFFHGKANDILQFELVKVICRISFQAAEQRFGFTLKTLIVKASAIAYVNHTRAVITG